MKIFYRFVIQSYVITFFTALLGLLCISTLLMSLRFGAVLTKLSITIWEFLPILSHIVPFLLHEVTQIALFGSLIFVFYRFHLGGEIKTWQITGFSRAKIGLVLWLSCFLCMAIVMAVPKTNGSISFIYKAIYNKASTKLMERIQPNTTIQFAHYQLFFPSIDSQEVIQNLRMNYQDNGQNITIIARQAELMQLEKFLQIELLDGVQWRDHAFEKGGNKKGDKGKTSFSAQEPFYFDKLILRIDQKQMLGRTFETDWSMNMDMDMGHHLVKWMMMVLSSLIMIMVGIWIYARNQRVANPIMHFILPGVMLLLVGLTVFINNMVQ